MDIAQTIKQRAQERGVDPELALAIAKAESGLRPQIKNPKSSAHGLFQIVDDTWKQYGGDPKRRKDVNENIRIGLEILADNQKALANTLGRAPRPGELYAGHFFGKTGAQRVLTADPDAPISTVVSERVLKANPQLLKGKTVSQALAALGAKVGDTGPGQSIPRMPDRKAAQPAYQEDPAKPPVISNAVDATRQYGAGYQAALALSYLSDTQEESDDPDAPSIVERDAREEMAEQAAEVSAPSGSSAAGMLANMDFGYAPVVGQAPKAPVKMADGGLLQQAASVVPISAAARKQYEEALGKWNAYSAQGESYNAALDKYNREVMTPYSAQVAAYNKAVDAWNAGPRTSALNVAAPSPSRQFTMAAPKEPNTLSPEQMDALMLQAQKRRALTAQALNVAADPSQFGLSMPALFAEGGEVTDPEAQLVMGAARKPVSPAQFGRGMLDTAAGMLKGSVQAAAGMPGDIEALGRMVMGASPKTVLPTTDDTKAFIDKYAPLNLPADPGTGGRTAAEYFGEFMSPAAATRPLVRGAQAVGAGVMEGAQRAEKALEAPVTRIMEGGGRAAEMLEALSPAPAQAMPGKVGAPAKTSAFTPLPTPEAPFVGRLDKFAAEMAGPMKKEQLLGTLKGKFKDYELERARAALEDLPDDAKVMPTDFLNRLNNVYNPAGYRTTVLEPQQGSFYQTMDNVFAKGVQAGNEPAPLGVIHLTQFMDPQMANQVTAMEKTASELYALSRAEPSRGMDGLLQWAKTQPDGVHIERLLTTGPVQKANVHLENMRMAKDAVDRMLYPNIHPELRRLDELPRTPEGYIDQNAWAQFEKDATNEVRQKGEQIWKELEVGPMLPKLDPNVNPDQAWMDSNYSENLRHLFRKYKEKEQNRAHDELYPVLDSLARLRERVAREAPYKGQHSSLKNPPLPISFSRFSEHTATVPGMGEVKGIYVHELQSDMLDDVRKMGPKGGSVAKDHAEYKKLEEQLNSMEFPTSVEAQRLRSRMGMLERRMADKDVTPYSVPEAFANMENAPQVIQQLMIKNAINGAVQRGNQFVAFPGKESAQAQLYEKLPRNLNEVAKELGKGFEVRPIELMLPNGEPAAFTAITWSPEAAQKLQKSGIPFAKGGMVERNNHDNRSYK